MQTIHTDAAYKALSRRNSGKFEAQTSLDQSVHHSERRTPVKVNDQDETHKQLLQGQEGASKCAWSTFCNKFLKAENVDSLVNSGLVAMVPFLVICSAVSLITLSNKRIVFCYLCTSYKLYGDGDGDGDGDGECDVQWVVGK
ncbi:hypothetical protein V6N12_023928 [Hibiscus sabdariffa]|uniref:Uncharacterized protein n=1 Tax=Hibiscus sabdariffa TaxID=183260 RepID=A0ABR2FZ32_9ROSI